MREILLAGDTNRLVAELTFVSRISFWVSEVTKVWIPAGPIRGMFFEKKHTHTHTSYKSIHLQGITLRVWKSMFEKYVWILVI